MKESGILFPPSEEEQKEGEQFKVNHKGRYELFTAIERFLFYFNRWIASKKKFRVTIDFDPEWTMLVRFNLSNQAESEMLDSLKPSKEIRTVVCKGELGN